MSTITDDLRRYGDAIEQLAIGGGTAATTSAQQHPIGLQAERTWGRRRVAAICVAAAASAIALGSLVTYGLSNGSPTVADAVAQPDASRETVTATGPWRSEPVPVGPLTPRGGHSVVWTGSEMLVWGGSADDSGQELLNDGAGFDPANGAWRRIAATDLAPRERHVAVWTGTEMMVVGGVGRQDGAAYDPAADSWRDIPAMPFALDVGSPAAVLVDDGLMIWSPVEDLVAIYDLDNNSWRTLPGTGLRGLGSGALRSDGRGKLVAVGATTPSSRTPIPLLQIAQWSDGAWDVLPEVGLSVPGLDLGAAPELTGWVNQIFVAWSDAGLNGGAVALNLASGSWESIAPPPIVGCESRPDPVSMGDRLLVVNGCGAAAIYDASAGGWEIVMLEGRPDGRTTVWTDDELLSWGDTCCYGTGDGSPLTVTAWRHVS